MGDAAEKLERLAGLLAELAPPPVPVPEWMPLRAEAKRRALSTRVRHRAGVTRAPARGAPSALATHGGVLTCTYRSASISHG